MCNFVTVDIIALSESVNVCEYRVRRRVYGPNLEETEAGQVNIS